MYQIEKLNAILRNNGSNMKIAMRIIAHKGTVVWASRNEPNSVFEWAKGYAAGRKIG